MFFPKPGAHPTISYSAMESACAAIMGGGGDYRHKVKSLSQVAYEALGADSITVYEYVGENGGPRRLSDIPHSVTILAAAGVREPEYLRGAAADVAVLDNIHNLYNVPNAEQMSPAFQGADFFETRKDLRSGLSTLFDKDQRHDLKEDRNSWFLDYQTEKYNDANKSSDDVDFACARVMLIKAKGTMSVRQAVGVAFFHFARPRRTRQAQIVFSEALKSAIWLVSSLIQELLIQVKRPLQSTLATSIQDAHLFRGIIDSLELIPDPAVTGLQPLAVAAIDSILKLTGSVSGGADFLYVIGGRLYIRYYYKEGKEMETEIFTDSRNYKSISGKCIRRQRTYLGNPARLKANRPIEKENPNQADDGIHVGLNLDGHEGQLDATTPQSLLVLPVALNNEVRCVVRAWDRHAGQFPDDLIPRLEGFRSAIAHGIIAMDDKVGRLRLARLLPELNLLKRLTSENQKYQTLELMLRAFGADRVRIYDIQSSDKIKMPKRGREKRGHSYPGIELTLTSRKPKKVPLVATDIPMADDERDFTAQLIHANTKSIGDTFFVRHCFAESSPAVSKTPKRPGFDDQQLKTKQNSAVLPAKFYLQVYTALPAHSLVESDRKSQIDYYQKVVEAAKRVVNPPGNHIQLRLADRLTRVPGSRRIATGQNREMEERIFLRFGVRGTDALDSREVEHSYRIIAGGDPETVRWEQAPPPKHPPGYDPAYRDKERKGKPDVPPWEANESFLGFVIKSATGKPEKCVWLRFRPIRDLLQWERDVVVQVSGMLTKASENQNTEDAFALGSHNQAKLINLLGTLLSRLGTQLINLPVDADQSANITNYMRHATATARLIMVMGDIAMDFGKGSTTAPAVNESFRELWDTAKYAYSNFERVKMKLKDQTIDETVYEKQCRRWLMLPLFDAISNALDTDSQTHVVAEVIGDEIVVLFVNEYRGSNNYLLKSAPLEAAIRAIETARKQGSGDQKAKPMGRGLKNMLLVLRALNGSGHIMFPGSVRGNGPDSDTKTINRLMEKLANTSVHPEKAWKLLIRVPFATN